MSVFLYDSEWDRLWAAFVVFRTKLTPAQVQSLEFKALEAYLLRLARSVEVNRGKEL